MYQYSYFSEEFKNQYFNVYANVVSFGSFNLLACHFRCQGLFEAFMVHRLSHLPCKPRSKVRPGLLRSCLNMTLAVGGMLNLKLTNQVMFHFVSDLGTKPQTPFWERGGIVVEHGTINHEILDSVLTCGTMLCP